MFQGILRLFGRGGGGPDRLRTMYAAGRAAWSRLLSRYILLDLRAYLLIMM